MPIPASGQISLDTIATEFGGTTPHSISEYYRSGGIVLNTPANAGIPTSGQIALNNFYGTSARIAVSLPIAANTNNYDVYTNRGGSYIAGGTDITVTVAAPVIVGSTSTGTYALLVPSAFNPADTITIVNNGVIQGMGGNGGAGSLGAGGAGSIGGNAIYTNRPVTITNNGVIASGGGGGGGGSNNFQGGKFPANLGGGGGGGGAGTNGGSGGAGAGSAYAGSAGGSGTSTAGGGGGAGYTGGAAGGAGGGRGANGINGTTITNAGGTGGTTGNYIVGNPFVTWSATGTRQGNVA